VVVRTGRWLSSPPGTVLRTRGVRSVMVGFVLLALLLGARRWTGLDAVSICVCVCVFFFFFVLHFLLVYAHRCSFKSTITCSFAKKKVNYVSIYPKCLICTRSNRLHKFQRKRQVLREVCDVLDGSVGLGWGRLLYFETRRRWPDGHIHDYESKKKIKMKLIIKNERAVQHTSFYTVIIVTQVSLL
jgi:hypothetical protein